MKVFKRLNILASKDPIEEEIEKFLYKAKETEWTSDMVTYRQIQRLGNPLADKIQKKIDSLGDSPQEKNLKNYLKDTLKLFKDHKYIGDQI